MNKICQLCWKEYPTRQGQTKYCVECSNKLNLCPICWKQKINIKDRVCRDCINWERICKKCWKHFIWNMNKKYCSKECFNESRRNDQDKYNLNKIKICEVCWTEFKEYWKWRHKRCINCSNKFICKRCWKLSSWAHNALICKECKEKEMPLCIECWKHVCNKKDKFCSLSCAWKYTSRNSEARKKQFEEFFITWWTKNSKKNDYRYDILSQQWLEVEREFRIDNDLWFNNIWQYCFYDLKVWNYLIEIDPTITHNSSISIREYKKPISKKYHQEKSLLWEKHWYHVIHLFDWDDRDFVKQWLIWLIKKRKRLYSKDIRIVDAKEANAFCDRNHLQWRWPSTIRYWLYVNWELINLLWMLYQNWEWNLNRFCSKCWYYIAHWAEKLFKRFLNDYNPDHVISFSDITKHSWWLYNALWFELEEIQNPSYRRVELKTWIPHRRRDCQKQRMHSLPWFNPEYKYIEHKDDNFWQQTEAQLMESHWYVRVFDSWMRKHVRHNQDKQTN